MNLTEHFTLEEFIRSGRARVLSIDNTPQDDLLPAMRFTCEGLERVRAILGAPLTIISGYRSPEVNTLVGGSPHSQHMKGEAADIIAPEYGSAHAVARMICKNDLAIGYDQLILDRNPQGHEWVHISFTFKPRFEALTMTPDGLILGIKNA